MRETKTKYHPHLNESYRAIILDIDFKDVKITANNADSLTQKEHHQNKMFFFILVFLIKLLSTILADQDTNVLNVFNFNIMSKIKFSYFGST